MPHSPFPGMDPYLEDPIRWPNFHNQLAVAICHSLASTLAPRYWVSIEQHAWIDEPLIEITALPSSRLTTAIAILSPSTKHIEDSRQGYEMERNQILRTSTNLGEIDLLRDGLPMPDIGAIKSPYRIQVRQGNVPWRSEVYAFGLSDRIPRFLLSLKHDDDDVQVDLNALVASVYERGAFYLAIDYTRAPVPPFSLKDTVWADDLLRRHGLR
jgi:hypothetical protein